ncbi:hypothetical protein NUSPORA_02144 [Nucleospora cyclopteri]
MLIIDLLYNILFTKSYENDESGQSDDENTCFEDEKTYNISSCSQKPLEYIEITNINEGSIINKRIIDLSLANILMIKPPSIINGVFSGTIHLQFQKNINSRDFFNNYYIISYIGKIFLN